MIRGRHRRGARTRPPATGHLLFVGTVAPRKNVDRLLTAYAQVRERRPNAPPLVLVGPATPESDQTLARLTRAPLVGHVRHAGYVTERELRTFYDEAVLLVLPSLDEGFGIPALEAMTVGVPVIAAARGALPEVVGDAGLLVDPLDVSALVDALERVLRDDQLRQRLSASPSWCRLLRRLFSELERTAGQLRSPIRRQSAHR